MLFLTAEQSVRVDIDKDTLTMSPIKLEKFLKSITRLEKMVIVGIELLIKD